MGKDFSFFCIFLETSSNEFPVLLNLITSQQSGCQLSAKNNMVLYAFQRYTIGLKKRAAHFLIQSEIKRKLIVTRSNIFPRFASAVLFSSFNWFIGFPVCFVIGQSLYFVFTTPESWILAVLNGFHHVIYAEV